MNVLQRLMRRPFFIRLFNWEYWSFGAVYTLIYPAWLLLSIRARSFFFFSASNPKIVNGGFLGESKKDVNKLMAPHLYPKTIHFDAGSDAGTVVQTLRDNGFGYPLIGKPDNGGRGRGVKLLNDDQDCIEYVKQAVVDFHIQQFINYPNEVGIFYYRYPDEANGRISGIVRKEFLKVTGNGSSTIRDLLLQEERYILQFEALTKMYGDELNRILPAGKERLLVPYGNHARGAKFLDETHLADEQVTRVVNDICKNIDEFYFGRLDIRYNTWEEFRNGKNFSVIEANGAGSEPTHMYDPRHSLFFAWKEIIRHWYILNRISRLNHKKGARYLTVKEGLKMFRDEKEHSKKLEQMP